MLFAEQVDVVMETKGGNKKKSSSTNTSTSRSSLQYEIPLGYSIEDIRPNGGIEKFRSAAYSNVRNPKQLICITIYELQRKNEYHVPICPSISTASNVLFNF